MPSNEKKSKKVFTENVDNKFKDIDLENEEKIQKRKLFFSLFKKRDKEKNTEVFKSVSFFKLFRFATKLDIFLMGLGSVGSLANAACLPLMLIVFMNIFDSFTDFGKFCNTTNTSNISYPSLTSLTSQMQDQALYLLYLGIATHALSYVQVTFWLIASQRQTRTIRKKLFESILKQDVGWFDVYKTGELNNRLSDDVNKIRDGIGDKCGNSLQYVATFLIGVIIALVKGWKLTLVVLSVSPLLFASSLLFTQSTADLTKSELTAYARAGNIAQEVFTAIRTVFAFNGAKKEHERYVKNLDDAKFYGIKKGFLNGVLMGFLWLTIFGAYALGFWYGWSLSVEVDPSTGKSAYSVGKILLVFFAILIGVFSLGNAGPFFGTAATARAAAYEIFEIIDRVPPIDTFSNQGKKLDNLIGNIQFQNVKFQYPSRPDIPILKGVNLKVDSGVTCALVGASGCGKSTCIQLLQRFYDPIEGSVFIDGINLKDLNVNWFRSQIGVVNQEPILFGTSILENIKFGKKDATDEEITQAAINANAHDFIMSLPDKYKTLVGDRGGQLSGGQKQRIAIARALVRNPKILLLDEATSALDTESESIVQAALDKARLGRTTLIVAHRLSTIRNADIIFAFEKGEIKEFGTHEELMERKGIYYNLVITQTKTHKRTKTNDDQSVDNSAEEDEADGSSDESNELNQNEKNTVINNTEKDVKSLSNLVINQMEIIDKKDEKDNQDSKEKKEKKKFFSFLQKEKKKEPKEKQPSMKEVFYMNRPEWGYIIVGCIASVIAGGIQPAFGIVLSKAVGLFASCSYDDQKNKITTYCIIFLVFAVASFVAYIIQNGMFAIAGEELTKRMRSKAFKSMLQQEIGWFDDLKNSVGVLTTKLAVEAAAVQGATGVRLGFVLMNVSNLGVGIIIAFAFSWPITLLIIGFVPFLIIGGAFQTKMLAGFSSLDKKNLEETGKITNESISNIRTVAQLNKEGYFVEKYNEKIDMPHKKGIQSANINGFILGLTTSVLFYAIAAAYSLGAYLIEKNLYGMSLENVMLVFNCVLFGAQSVGQASALLPDYSKAKEAVKSMFDLFERKPLINNWDSSGSNGIKLGSNEFLSEIILNHVEFTYPSRKEAKILKGLDLNIKSGQKIALVGSSGCGKSTVTQLLERFYDPDAGTITLSNRKLQDFDLQWLRSQIAIVSQEPILFDMSIKQNIEYGDNSREVSMDEIIEAAKKANIHDFISNLPKGYETNVGSKGTQLSGGQKQRIAIARALVRNPKILLLDEATSALDTESETLVQDALDKAQEGRTCIIIAHRLSTIKNCDKIFVIKNGHVIEAGSHNELLDKNGFYAKLNGQHR